MGEATWTNPLDVRAALLKEGVDVPIAVIQSWDDERRALALANPEYLPSRGTPEDISYQLDALVRRKPVDVVRDQDPIDSRYRPTQ